MSLILDALKKLDREKSSRRNGAANISAEILKTDQSHPRKRIPWYFAAIPLTAVATAAITYALVGGFGNLPKSPPPSLGNAPAPSQQMKAASHDSFSLSKSSSSAPVNPLAPVQRVKPAVREIASRSKISPPLSGHPPVATQRVKPAPREVASLPKSSPPSLGNPPALAQQGVPAPPSPKSARTSPKKTKLVPPSTQRQVEEKNISTSRAEEKAGQKLILEGPGVPPGNTKITAEPSPSGSATTPSSLRISAIIWYEEPSKRFAMINGVIANEGSTIEGVKVVEIHPTAIRFLHNDRHFEISISK